MARKRVSIPKKVKTSVFNKYGGHCAYCGCDLVMTKKESLEKNMPSMQIDHQVPWRNRNLTEEELNHFDNLMPSCGKCNLYKRAKSLEGYRKFLKELHLRIEKQYCVQMGIKYGLLDNINKWNGIFYFEKDINNEEVGIKETH